MTAARTLSIILFGILPGLFIAYLSVRGLSHVPTQIDAGRFAVAGITAVIGLTSIVGMASLGARLIGVPIYNLRWGFVAGLFMTLSWVAAPFIYMMLDSIGLYEPTHRSGWDNYGIGVMISILSVLPTLVFTILTVLSFKKAS